MCFVLKKVLISEVTVESRIDFVVQCHFTNDTQHLAALYRNDSTINFSSWQPKTPNDDIQDDVISSIDINKSSLQYSFIHYPNVLI